MLAGYATVDTSMSYENGTAAIRLDQHTRFKATLLGSELNSETRLMFVMRAAGKSVLEHSGQSSNGPTTVDWELHVRDGVAQFHSSLGPGDQELELSPDVVVENTLFYDFVVHDFLETALDARTAGSEAPTSRSRLASRPV